MTTEQDNTTPFKVGDEVTMLTDGAPCLLGYVTKLRKYKTRSQITVEAVNEHGDMRRFSFDATSGDDWDALEWSTRRKHVRLRQPGDSDAILRQRMADRLKHYDNWNVLSLEDVKAILEIIRAAEAKEGSST